MKHVTIVACLLFIFFLSSRALFAQEELGKPEEPVVEIVAISGSVQVCPAPEQAYEDAEEDMFLSPGDKIKTADNSYAELAFDEDADNVLRLDSNALATIILEEGEKIELSEGEAFTTLDNLPQGSSFEIRTPTTVAGVLGTSWTTKVSDEGTDVESLDGDVYVKGFNQDGSPMPDKTVVSSGYSTRIQKFQRPLMPQRFSDVRRQKLQMMKRDVVKRARNVINKRKMQPGAHFRKERMQRNIERRLEKRKAMPQMGKPQQKSKPPMPPKPIKTTSPPAAKEQITGDTDNSQKPKDQKKPSQKLIIQPYLK
ncbi:MAG: FecR family protein [Candidatus Omnitrophota bacterium]